MDEKDQVLEEKTEMEMPAEGEMPAGMPENFPPMGGHGSHGGPGMPPPPPHGFPGGPGMPPPPPQGFDGKMPEMPEMPAAPEDAPAAEAPAAE
ncbi:MAG: hypothetical protein Q4F31_10220 [Eubacteriales bacterium]|nr:hypothetical protein [Eubacteriales bacterium]